MISRKHALARALIGQDKPPSEQSIQDWLRPIGFTDCQPAFNSLQRLARDSGQPDHFAEFLPTLLSVLADAASPDRALINFEHLLEASEDRPFLIRSLIREPRLVETLVVLFSGSQFLTDILLRNPNYLGLIQDRNSLAEPKVRLQFLSETEQCVASLASLDEQLDALRVFQRRELFRIGSGDLLGLLDLPRVARQLSYLAVSLVRTSLTLVSREIEAEALLDGFAVLALGKLGGRELNYSSDIDLLFFARENRTDYQRLGERLIEALSKATPEGFLYRVDMRLRPWGQVGTLVPSLHENLKYLHKSAQVWEKQAMYKGRFLAGNAILAIEFLQEAKSLIAALEPEILRAEMMKMKEKMEGQLKRRGRQWGEVKAGAGSIRDVEFVTQYLQQAHGKVHPEVHSRNTLDGLARLRTCGILPANEHGILAEGYTFLRSAEHHLQIMHNRQTHVLPKDARELAYLARRLGFRGSDAGAQFVKRYKQHSSAIREIYRYYILTDQKGKVLAESKLKGLRNVAHARQAERHLSRLDMAYALAFSDEEIQLHIEMAGQLSSENPVEVRTERLSDLDWRVTIVAFDYLGELSLICGLLFEISINIIEGHIFTYEPADPASKSGAGSMTKKPPRPKPADTRRKIVDVFTVRPTGSEISEEIWRIYSLELAFFVKQLKERKQREVHGELAKRVASKFQQFARPKESVLPVDIAIDNHTSENYTILRIDTPDTIGFLFELTNALALNGIYISRVKISSLGQRVHDTLFVSDIHGNKITDPEKQHYLRTATVLVQHFTHLLPSSPNPESAMLHFGEFVANLFSRPDWPKELASLNRPDVLSALAKLLGASDFLWNDFLRVQHTNLFPVLNDLRTLSTTRSKGELEAELEQIIKDAVDFEPKTVALNAFKDREMFRIDMRYINGLVAEFDEFTNELSELAEVVITAAFHLCFDKLISRFGSPYLGTPTVCRSCVCGLGKFGGREVGVASDIELLFIYEGAGHTVGAERISNAEFFEKVVSEVRKTIRAKQAGIFELDFRLRPYGQAGNLAIPIESFEKYYTQDGPAWDYERQALVKLRPVWGEPKFRQSVRDLRDKLLYERPTLNVAAMRAMRERQVRQLVEGGTLNAKFGVGGLVDVEFLVQGLQLKYGAKIKDLRVSRTVKAMAVLASHGILSADDFQHLQEAHAFFRKLIEALRIVRGHARDLTVPGRDSQDFSFLARRLGYGEDLARLEDNLMRYFTLVHEMSNRLLE